MTPTQPGQRTSAARAQPPRSAQLLCEKWGPGARSSAAAAQPGPGRAARPARPRTAHAAEPGGARPELPEAAARPGRPSRPARALTCWTELFSGTANSSFSLGVFTVTFMILGSAGPPSAALSCAPGGPPLSALSAMAVTQASATLGAAAGFARRDRLRGRRGCVDTGCGAGPGWAIGCRVDAGTLRVAAASSSRTSPTLVAGAAQGTLGNALGRRADSWRPAARGTPGSALAIEPTHAWQRSILS